jgi:hypothetical protein
MISCPYWCFVQRREIKRLYGNLLLNRVTVIWLLKMVGIRILSIDKSTFQSTAFVPTYLCGWDIIGPTYVVQRGVENVDINGEHTSSYQEGLNKYDRVSTSR